MIKTNIIYNKDCIEGMKELPNESVDMILCDLPYGVTQNKKDIPLDLNKLWKQYNRIIKEKGVIILTAQFPYTVELILSQKNIFRYDLIWDKKLTSGFLNANRMPLRCHEHILVFYKKLGTYNPQFETGKPLHSRGVNYKTKKMKNRNYGKWNYTDDLRKGSTEKYPKSIIQIQKPHPSKARHRTEKPVELAEYLIKTYSNKEDIILDNCIGTGWTALACKKLNRQFIGYEIDPQYYQVSMDRLNAIEFTQGDTPRLRIEMARIRQEEENYEI